MTRNAYGVETEIDLDVFNDWDDWGDYQPQDLTDLIMGISRAAAKTVLDVIARNSHIALYSTENDCVVRVSLGEGMGALSISFAGLIDDWVSQEGPDEEARAPLIAALEAALAKVKALI